VDDALCNEEVTCCGCKRVYNCSPEDDYYDATNNKDGVCLQCFQAKSKAPSIGGASPDA